MGRQASQRLPSRCGTRPPMFRTSVFAPRLGTSLPTGATALEVQQDANHHSRYDVSQRKRRNVPQEVFHGVPPFSGGVPHKNAAYTVSLLKARVPQRSRGSARTLPRLGHGACCALSLTARFMHLSRQPANVPSHFRLSDGTFVFAGSYGVVGQGRIWCTKEEEAFNVSSPPFLCFCHQSASPGMGGNADRLGSGRPFTFFQQIHSTA